MMKRNEKNAPQNGGALFVCGFSLLGETSAFMRKQAKALLSVSISFSRISSITMGLFPLLSVWVNRFFVWR